MSASGPHTGGVLVVDKPKGPTSHDVVERVRRALGNLKAGHTGTLDPMATGVLPVVVGEATKLSQFILEKDKAYEAAVQLGVSTDSYDAMGNVAQERPVPALSHELLEAALAKFRGSFEQKPPMFSAVKVAGKRLYELARKGEEVERPSRPVTVHELVLQDFTQSELRLKVRCSKGFFVRTLAHELGEALGCGAHLKALRRTLSGPFTLEQALPLEKIEQLGAAAVQSLVSMERALEEMPAFTVSAAEVSRVLHGGVVELAGPPGLHRVLSPSGQLLAIAELVGGRLKYRRVMQG
ncbi:MAG: tRNA pseudouridine(55) synthase TruB [Myxococcaceae bacterium]